MPSFKQLNSKHTNYNADQIDRLTLLYQGGYSIQRRAKDFLTRLMTESDPAFNERAKSAAYIPFLSQFVDFFASSLFSEEMSVSQAADATDASTLGTFATDEAFYKLFQSNADLHGNSLHSFVQDRFTEAAYLPNGTAYIGIDFPEPSDDDRNNLLEEETLGLSRAYLYQIDPTTVIDWKCDDETDKFEWVKLRRDVIIQDAPLAAPMYQIEFCSWTMRNGLAHWERYLTEPRAKKEDPSDRTEVALAADGDTSFREIPIIKLHIPLGIAVGEKMGPIVEEYFQSRSIKNAHQNKACVTIPVIYRGEQIGAPGEALPSNTQQNPFRGTNPVGAFNNRGWVEMGDWNQDKIEIVETKGEALGFLAKSLDDLRDLMHQLVHQMANSVTNNSKAMGRSADSKEKDQHATEILLSAYARVAKDFVKKLYTCISTARKEAVVWTVHGLCTMVDDDRDSLLKEALVIPNISIPSPTFKKIHTTKLALQLAGPLSPEEEATIKQEIEEAVDSEPEDDHQIEPDGDEEDGKEDDSQEAEREEKQGAAA